MYGCVTYDMLTKPKERIALSTMFLFPSQGVIEMQEDMAKHINKNPNLKTKILLDYNRAIRKHRLSPSSYEGLKKLRKQLEKKENFEVGYFKTPI